MTIPHSIKFRTSIIFKQTGFTLVELLITMVVLAILATIGIPSFTALIANNRATTATNELLAALQYTRSEAVRQNASFAICSSTDGQSCSTENAWHNGWIVTWGNDEPVQIWPAFNPAIEIVGPPSVTFGSAGEATVGVGQFQVNATGGAGATRRLCLEASGRAFVGACANENE